MMRRIAVTVAAALLGAVGMTSLAMAGGMPAAQVGDWTLSLSTVDQTLSEKGRLQEILNSQYRIRLEMIQELVSKELLKREAEATKSTPEALLEQEVTKKLTPVGDKDVEAFIQGNQDRLPKEDPKLKDKVRNFLTEQKLDDAKAEYLGTLATKHEAKILLPEPVPPRIQIPGEMTPSRGESTAPVSLVVFSDFQCPYCKKVEATLKSLLKLYPKELKIVFRHNPMPFHKDAAKASEASQCANDQNKFWEFHDLLFEHQDKMDEAMLNEHVKTLKLDEAAYKECMSSGRAGKRVKQDLEIGHNLGITGTPTFFINGLRLVGAVPEQQFRLLIDTELSRFKQRHGGDAATPAAPAEAAAPAK